MKVYLKKLPPKSPKKYQVTVGTHTVKFGAHGYSNFTIHKDPLRMQRYLIRHQARENWADPLTPGFWSRWLLWSEPSLKDAKALIKRKFGLVVVTDVSR